MERELEGWILTLHPPFTLPPACQQMGICFPRGPPTKLFLPWNSQP